MAVELSTRRVDILNYARTFMGVPYYWSGKNRLQGFDCSGFVCEVIRAFGAIGSENLSSGMLLIKFPISNAGLPIGGELLFFGKTAKEVVHVAMALPNLRMIEAGHGDRTTTTFEIAAKQGAMVQERPIRRRDDFLGWSPWPGLDL